MRVNLAARAANAETKRARTRARLIAAAIEVIEARGTAAANIEDFVTAAGVSRGTFYNYFPTFDHLIQALNRQTSEDANQILDPLLVGIGDPAARLATVIHRVMSAFAQQPVRAWLVLQAEGLAGPPQPVFQARFDEIFSSGVACGRFRDVDRWAARDLLFGAMRMVQLEILGRQATLERLCHLVALILTAFGVAPAEAEEISRMAALAATGEGPERPCQT